VGTVEEILEEFRLFHASGCSKFVIRLAGENADEFLAQAKLFAEGVMPFIDES
jgi:hypothetical protein